jgi:sugar lactone lactonase YvrE
MQRGASAGTIRLLARVAAAFALMSHVVAGSAQTATFTAAPILFPPAGDNSGQVLSVNVKVNAASAIRSISIPLPFGDSPEFFVVDQGGCVEDGTTVNAAGTTCSLLVRFHPRRAGRRNATLLITDGAGVSTAIPISGIGYYPQIAVIPSAIKVVAGQGPGTAALAGDGEAAILASLNAPQGIAVDSFSNVYFADTGNNVVRMLDAFGNITTIAGGGTTAGAAADGGAATAALLNQPTWLAVDAAGNLYIAESGSHVIRRVAMSSTRTITTVAGSYAQGSSGDGATATAAMLNNPQGIAVDGFGNLYIADSGNHRIRQVDPVTGNISAYAGDGNTGFNASSVAALSAQFSSLGGLALDASNNLFIADTGNHAIRGISDGNVTVVAGTGTAGSAGDGGAAIAATLQAPMGLAISPAGDIYIADRVAGTLRKVQAFDGTIETVAGISGKTGSFTPGVRPSTSLQMTTPTGIAFDPQANLFLSETNNNVIRELQPSPSELNFAAQSVGNTSAPASFKIENIGNTPLTLGNVTATDSTTSSNFTLAASTTNACASTLSAGAHCTYNVSFAPTVTGFLAGEFDITYQSNNPNFNSTAPVIVTGGVLSDLAINPASLSPVVQNHATSIEIDATGGVGAVTFDVEGSLPPGMTWSASGARLTLTGTPTQAGAYNLTVFATDALGDAATRTYALQILPAIIAVTVTESVNTADSATVLPSLSVTVTESIHTADALTETPSLAVTVTEAIHVTDMDTDAPEVYLPVVETIHVSDGLNNLPSVTLAVTEAVHVSDGINDLPGFVLNVTEAVHVTDGITPAAGAVLNVTETITVIDDVSSSATKASQTIDPQTIPTHTYGDATFTVNAKSSSGLPVAVALESGPATLTGTSVSLTGAGTVKLLFTQAGNANYDPAPSVERTFTVSPATATVTAGNASRAYETANPAFTFTLGGLVHGDTAAVVSGAPALSTTAVMNSPAGSYPITATQGTLASPNYTFTFVPGTLTVTGHVAQTITFLAIPGVPLAISPLTLTAHSSSGLTVTYTVTGPATLAKSKLTITGSGTVTVTASQPGNATFDPAPTVTRTFQVTP